MASQINNIHINPKFLKKSNSSNIHLYTELKTNCNHQKVFHSGASWKNSKSYRYNPYKFVKKDCSNQQEKSLLKNAVVNWTFNHLENQNDEKKITSCLSLPSLSKSVGVSKVDMKSLLKNNSILDKMNVNTRNDKGNMFSIISKTKLVRTNHGRKKINSYASASCYDNNSIVKHIPQNLDIIRKHTNQSDNFSTTLTNTLSQGEKRKIVVATKTKLIREKSAGSKNKKVLKKNEAFKNKFKLINNFDSCSLSKFDRKLKYKVIESKFYKEDEKNSKSKKYAVISRTKLIRRQPVNLISTKILENHKYLKLASQVSTKQKVAQNILSKYYTYSLLNSKTPILKNNAKRQQLCNQLISIRGVLYKSSKTALQKHCPLSRTKNMPSGSLIVDSHQRKHIVPLFKNKYWYRSINKPSFNFWSVKNNGVLIRSKCRVNSRLSKNNDNCLFYCRYGKCIRKEKGTCPFVHDPSKVAVCTRFLKGRCQVKNCLFLHKYDPNKMPVCSHFLKAACTREACPYRHVNVNPKAPPCIAFLKGYCKNGDECKHKHVLICEEFNTNGKCSLGKKCLLKHHHTKKKKHDQIVGKNLVKCKRMNPTGNLSKIGDKLRSSKIVKCRYFEDSNLYENELLCYNDKLTLSLADDETSYNSLGTVGPANLTEDFQVKRARVLNKVNTLVKSLLQGTSQDSVHNPLCPALICKESEPHEFVEARVPLAASLPEFIPLIFVDSD